MNTLNEDRKLSSATWMLFGFAAALYLGWHPLSFGRFGHWLVDRLQQLSSWIDGNVGFTEVMLTAIFLAVVGVGVLIAQQRQT